MSIDRADIGVSIAKQKAVSDDSSIARAQANLEAAKLAYEATLPIVKAPVSGAISDIILVAGMTIGGSGGSGTSAASGNGTSAAATGSNKLATIVAGEFATAEFSLTEIDIVKVKKGQKATIIVDALTDKSFTGKVIGIDKSGSVSSGVTTYPITVQITTTSDEILPNMTVTASIITETKDDVLIIPAGVTQTLGTQAAVTVLKDKKTQQVPVQLGLASENNVEVVSGLAEGDEIVVATISGQPQSSQARSSSPFGNSRIGPGGMGAMGGGGGPPR
jgi:macrolide-specific efflux system membrane fusion protein